MEKASMYPKASGVYKLTCTRNNKIYIGKTINFCRRIKDHKNSKRSDRLQNAIRKHGWDSFEFEILEVFENFDILKDNEKLLEREAYFIKLYDSTNNDIGYNICRYSSDRAGIPLTEEHKEKVRLGNIGKKRSEETKRRMSYPKSEAFKANLRKPKTEETKKNMSLSRLGKKRKPFTEEHRENIRKAQISRRLRENNELTS